MTWNKSSGFVWSMLGSAIGFANILSFSAQCYKHGGGAFLIPFGAAILALGLPMLVLEGIIGNRMTLPIVSAYGHVAGRVGKLFGWLSVMAVATIGTFYIVLTGYSLVYAYLSATSAIPADTATFFKQTFLQDSGSLATFGAFSWPIFIAMAACCGFAWIVLARSIRSGVEKVCSICLPILVALIGLFAVVVCFLPGATTGFINYLAPDWSRLAEASLWRDVFGHVFFSFSLGLGIVTGYARHTKSTTSIPRAMFYVALGDLVVSVVAGFVVFGCVGYLSHTTGTPFASIVSSDSTFEMGFVIFPKILQAFGPLAPYIGLLFFGCLFIAGITGVFSIQESIMGNIQIEFSRTRRTAATITGLLTLMGATLFCFGNGQSIIGALAPMVLGKNMLLGGLAQVMVFLYFSKSIRADEVWRSADGGKSLSYKCLKGVVPVILALILIASLYSEFQGTFTLSDAISWGWFLGALGLSMALTAKRTPQEATARLSPAVS